MNSEWKVESNTINGTTMYCVYRIIDTEKPNYSGNREYASSYVHDYSVALETATLCNEVEGQNENEK